MLLKRTLTPRTFRQIFAPPEVLSGTGLPYVRALMRTTSLATTQIFLNHCKVQQVALTQNWSPVEQGGS
jgi:site-specific recombinase XerD